jgi:hypothetical protein
MPFRPCSPRSSKCRCDPAARSLTVSDTKISPAAAAPWIRAPDRACAVDGSPRDVEAHEEAIARRVDLNALKPDDLVSDSYPILFEERAPSCVAESIGMIRR